MRLTAIAMLGFTLWLAGPAAAQESPLQLYCEACRDVVDYPADARNFGLNQLYGAESWLTFDEADRFDLVDPFGNRVTIDINIRYVVLDLSFVGNDVPFALSFILQIRLVYPNGDILAYRFDLADLDANGSLPVPASVTGTSAGAVQDTDSSGSSEDDEDYPAEDDAEPVDYEFDDGSCDACEAYFDADQDGVLDDDPVEWIEEL
jgi:hypothetical protein